MPAITILALALLRSPMLAWGRTIRRLVRRRGPIPRPDIDDKLFPVTFKDVELDVYHLRPDIDNQTVTFSTNGFTGKTAFTAADLHITAVALNALYRVPLARSADFPRGRLHPYVGVGIAALIAHFETRTTVLDTSTEFGDTDARPGAQAVAGAKYFVTPHGLTTHVLQAGIAYHW